MPSDAGRTRISPTGEAVHLPNGWPPSSFCGGSTLELAPDFDEFCGLLIAHHVEFALVGAYAL